MRGGLAMTVFVVLGLALQVALMLLFFRWLFRRVRAEGARRLSARFGDSPLLRWQTDANFIGLSSLGPAQIRGAGVLALTADELWYSRFIPRKDLSIPVSGVLGVRLGHAHVGKLTGETMLIVRFRTGADREDAVAWVVREPHAWKDTLEALRSHAS